MAQSLIGVGLAIFGIFASAAAQDVITADSHFFGESPAVFPSPNISGTGDWASAYSKARELVSQMTLEEKVNLTAGYSANSACSGIIPSIERLKFPGMCLSDAGQGLRNTDFVSSWPSGIHVGASWNKELARERAVGMGKEFKKKGVNVLLGPVVGPVGRVVRGGRNWEGFSTDPYLGGSLVYGTVAGVQSAGVITSTKHYIGNEQETNRNPEHNISAVSSNIDDVTMHELYLWPFQDALHAGTANIMCSYNRVNNSYGCQNSKALNGILKEELGFQGFVVSDWGGLHGGVDAALAGMDVAMPDSGGFWGEKLVEGVKNGSLAEWRIDDMATRVIASWYKLNQDQNFPEPGIGMPADLEIPHKIIDARDIDDRDVLFQGAVEGHVLVKNRNSSLPLRKPKLLSLFGYSAKAPDQNDVGGSWVFGFESNLNSKLWSSPSIAANGTLLSGGGSGATSQTTFSSPFSAILARAEKDYTQVFWDFSTDQPRVHGTSDACLVIGNAFAAEGHDRPNLRDNYTDSLVLHVARRCANTVVVLHNAGIRLVDQWIDHPNVTAVIFAHLPGEKSGEALVSLLYGDASFSGKLPYTVAKRESDYGKLVDPDLPSGQYAKFPQSNFSEGVFIDYRHFDRENIEPRFEFGFGLSYTTFKYGNLAIDRVVNGSNHTGTYPRGPTVEGGPKDLWDVVARVRAEVSNTGGRDGAEVAQLYVGVPSKEAPARQLRGFEKRLIKRGETATLLFELTRRDLSVWDVVAQKWRLDAGAHKIYVGSSSRKLPLTGELVIPGGNYTRRF